MSIGHRFGVAFFSGADRGVRLSLLGGFQLIDHGHRVSLTFHQQRVVALLALRNRPIRRPSAAGILWPDMTERQASASLRSVLWGVGRRIRLLIMATRTDLSLSSEVTVDAHDVAALSHRVLNSEDELGDVALRDLYGWEELLPDWHDDWIEADREQLRHRRVHTLEAVGARLANEGRFADAVHFALRAIAADPFRDTAHSLLIRVYLAEGNNAAARRHYEAYRDSLRQELGAEPSSELAGLMP